MDFAIMEFEVHLHQHTPVDGMFYTSVIFKLFAHEAGLRGSQVEALTSGLV